MQSYVDRSFATLDSLSEEMKRESKTGCQVVLHFIGPSGTGKTTTLRALFYKMGEDNKDEKITLHYFDAQTENVEGLQSHTYVFVDNAQRLFEKMDMISWLQRAEALCLAFSPVLIQTSGRSTQQFPIQYTKRYNFKPFNKNELDEYVAKNDVSEDVIKQAENIGVGYLPRMIHQCTEGKTRVDKWLHEYICSIMLKCSYRMNEEFVPAILLKAAMGSKLQPVEEAIAKLLGLFYEECSVLQLVVPSTFLLQYLRAAILASYSLFKQFATGAAIEFLVCAQLQSQSNTISCKGKEPTPLGNRLESSHESKGEMEIVIPAAEECVSQAGYDAVIEPHKKCCLVKLCESHFGIDYLIIDTPAGAGSRKLFLVQVSATRYQERSGPRLREVYEKKSYLGDKSVMEFYCEKLHFRTTECFFVYATTVVSKKNFTHSQCTQNKVYFLEVSIPCP